MNLALTGVAVRFGAVQALRGVDLALAAGGVHALIGPNGAGKSTLLGVLLGLVRPNAGTLALDGKTYDLARAATPFSLRRRLGYLPEAVAFAEALSGRQVLRFFLRARGVPGARADALLERVGLAAAARRPVRGYSRGMRQRLGLAIALCAEPDLLVLDEPTGGLDQEGVALLWEVLQQARDAGRTVVLTTHDLTLVERRVTELVVMSDGAVIARGSATDLRARAALPSRLRLSFEHAEHAARCAAQLAERGVPGVTHAATEVTVAASGTELLAVAGAVHRDATGLSAARVEEPGLDDVYDALLAEVGA